ncbi:MAG: DUF1697 domain-containing protein [Solirubrobacteraceae bacterium]
MRQIVLLRGINLGSTRRVAMPALRELLTGAGYEDVRTYVQSGNVVLSSDAPPRELERDCAKLISAGFGFEVPVAVRTRDELAEVVKRNPLAKVATEPKRYQVSFLSEELDAKTVTKLQELAAEPERLVVIGREAYAWHPEGVARSKLWNKLAGKGLGVSATARNWTTVSTLLAMADE